jgi:succinoglycan biosynthesis transport protein ExoP
VEHTNNPQVAPAAREVSLEYVLQVLRRRWLVVVGITVVTGLLGFGAAHLHHETYTASATVVFGNSDMSGIDQQASGLSNPVAPSPIAQSATNVLLLTEGRTAARTATIVGHGLTAAVVAASTTVAPQGQSNAVSVSATATDPALAALIANTYVNQFIVSQRVGDRAAVAQAHRLVARQLAALSSVQRAGVDGQALADRAESLSILESLADGNVKLLNKAGVPTSPSSSGPLQDAGLGLLVGLILGLTIAFLLERLDHRLRDPEEMERAFGLPVVGHIPERRALSDRRTTEEGPLSASAADLEAFRMLRAYLRYFNVDREIKTILVTSIAPGDGKTTVAWRLAEAAAMSGAETLLIEADLRKPDLAGKLGLRRGPGLAETLVTPGTMAKHIQDGLGVRRDDRKNGMPETQSAPSLDVLVAGSIPPNPGELLESEQMANLMSSSASNYDLVIIDTPPLAVVSDAIPLLRNVDGVLIIGRLEKNTRDSARHFRSTLRSLAAPVLGLVVNGVKSRDIGYGYGYYGYDDAARSANGSSDSARNGPEAEESADQILERH